MQGECLARPGSRSWGQQRPPSLPGRSPRAPQNQILLLPTPPDQLPLSSRKPGSAVQPQANPPAPEQPHLVLLPGLRLPLRRGGHLLPGTLTRCAAAASDAQGRFSHLTGLVRSLHRGRLPRPFSKLVGAFLPPSARESLFVLKTGVRHRILSAAPASSRQRDPLLPPASPLPFGLLFYPGVLGAGGGSDG